MRWLKLVAVVVAAMVSVAACGGPDTFSLDGQSAAEAAVGLIEGDAYAQRLGIASITDVQCQAPSDEVGTVFRCSGLSDGRRLEVDVTIEDESSIFADPLNWVAGDLLPDYATSAVDILNTDNDLDLPAGSIDCGDRSIVLGADRQHVCTLSNPALAEDLNAVLTFIDLSSAVFAVEVQRAD